MSKQDLIKKLKHKNPSLNQSEIETIINTFSENILKALKDDKNIELRGFGTFFVKKIKEKNQNLNLKSIEIIIDTFSLSIQKALFNRRSVEIRGFGTFFLKKIIEKHNARNPRTGKLIYVPEKNKVRFRVSKKFLKELNE